MQVGEPYTVQVLQATHESRDLPVANPIDQVNMHPVIHCYGRGQNMCSQAPIHENALRTPISPQFLLQGFEFTYPQVCTAIFQHLHCVPHFGVSSHIKFLDIHAIQANQILPIWGVVCTYHIFACWTRFRPPCPLALKQHFQRTSIFTHVKFCTHLILQSTIEYYEKY